jgi:hypothetical protein
MALACTGQFDSNSPSVGGQSARASAGSSGRGAQPPPQVDAGEVAESEVEDAAAASTGGSGGSGALTGRAGAGGSGGSGSVANATPPCDAVEVVLLPHCGGGSCHSNPSARIGDWAVNRTEAESFVDVPSVRDPACGLIIDSADPAESLLLRKLTGDFPSPKCGGFMPVSGGDLTDQEIACMASWLTQFQR